MTPARPPRRARRAGGPDRYVEVVLDDQGPADPVADPPAGAPGAPGARGSGRPPGRRSRRGAAAASAAAVAAAAMLVALVGHGAADERDRAALRPYAHLPGVVDSLRDPLDGARLAADVADDPARPGADRDPASGSTSPGARVLDRSGTGFGVRTQRLGGRWYRADGAPGPAWQGRLAEPAVTDGSAPRVLLLESADGGRLQGWDVVDGTVAWQRTGPGRPLVRLDGRVVLGAADRLEAVDVRTGESVWVVHAVGETLMTDAPALTDGLRVAVAAYGDDGAVTLTAYALDTGARQWTTPLGE